MKQQNIDDYRKHKNIHLDYKAIERNEALRFIAKIMLNSFFGKLAQRPNLPQTEIVQCPNEYYNIVNDDRKEIKADLMVTSNTMLVSTVFKDASDAPFTNINLAIASYVTAYARLKLLKLMENIESQSQYSVFYHDTDSVIYVREYTDPVIKTGDYLGELTNEFEQFTKARCTKFASLGPKNYGYELDFPDGKISTKMKVKGLCLSENTLDIVSFKKMIHMAQEYTKGIVESVYVHSLQSNVMRITF